MRNRLNLIVILTLLLSTASAFGQAEICRNIYVWPFNIKGDRSVMAHDLTNDVEAALTQFSCIVLQRRDFATLSAQAENEAQISSLKGLSESATEELQTIRAEVVLFGSVEEDFGGNVALRLSFQRLATKEILKNESVLIASTDARNWETRKEAVRRLIAYCVAPDQFNEENAWANVEKINTEDAYRKYLTDYPQGNFRSIAEKVLEDEARWKAISVEANDIRRIDLLEDYRIKYIRHLSEANAMLEEYLWKKSKYNRYLEIYPDGKYASLARERLEKKEGFWDKVTESLTDAVSDAVKSKEEEKKPDEGTKTETQPPPSSESTVPSSIRTAVFALQNQLPTAKNNYELFALEGGKIQHYWRSWSDGKWRKGAPLGENPQSTLATFQNQAPGAQSNFEVFVLEGGQIQHYWFSHISNQWNKGSRFGENVLSAPAAIQNMSPVGKYNYEVFFREGSQIQHYWRNWADGQWHKGARFGENVQSAAVVFQNAAPAANYNLELFVQEGNQIQHYWRSQSDGQWRKGQRIGVNVQSAPAAFQNAAPAGKYNYEVFFREGSQIQHYWRGWSSGQWQRGGCIGTNVQSAPTVFQNLAADSQYNYEVFVIEDGEIQHYGFTFGNGQWGKRGQVTPVW